MKRGILTALILLIAVSSATAAKLYIGPMSGSYGVNLASPYYKADANYPTPPEHHNIPSLDSSITPGLYCDDNMVGGGSFENALVGDSFTVSVTCPSGFNFVSQSNNAFIRPFGLLFVVSKGSRHGDTQKKEAYRINSSSSNRTTINSDGYNSVWFDIILLLPGELSDDGKSIIDENGKMYPLADEKDYVATVTITIESSAASPSKLTISIPFTGFFDSDSDVDKNQDAMNVSISTTPAASNLDIKTLSETQEPKKVADIEMYYFKGTARPSSSYPKMFLSANNDPFTYNQEGFKLLHSSVGYDTPRTSYNSIGYTVSTQSYGEPDLSKPVEVLAGTEDTSMPSGRVYYGDEYSNDNGATIQRISGGSASFVYPRFYHTEPFTESGRNFDYYYFYWKGGIYVTLEPMSSGIMYPGIYRDTIYFHVIYE